MKTKLLSVTVALLLLCALLLCGCGGQKCSQNGSDTDATTDYMIGDDVLDSFHKVNYYAAKAAIAATAKIDTEAELSHKTPSPSLTLLSNSEDVPFDSEPEIDVTPPEGPLDVIGFEDISNETLTLTRAYYCVIEIKDNGSFLCDQVGAGRAELVITDLRIGINPYAVLTVKNGDRYFSCLSEMSDLQNGKNQFFPHLYISGFCFYKDLTGGISTVEVNLSPVSGIRSVVWYPYSSSGIPAMFAVFYDVEENSSRFAEHTFSFTLAELAAMGDSSLPDPIETEEEEETGTGTSADSGNTDPGYGLTLIQQNGRTLTPYERLAEGTIIDSNGDIGVSTSEPLLDGIMANYAKLPALFSPHDLQADLHQNGTILSIHAYRLDENGQPLRSPLEYDDLSDLGELESGNWLIVIRVIYEGTIRYSGQRMSMLTLDYAATLRVVSN